MSHNHEKVARALALLEEVRRDLNTRTKDCACCGRPLNEDWPQKQVADTLDGSIQKLHRLLGSADDRLEKRQPPAAKKLIAAAAEATERFTDDELEEHAARVRK